MIVKCKEWPIVLKDDDGIRPAGNADECFYCYRKVGEPHAQNCVCVTSVVKYRVYMNLGDGEREVGTFQRHDPYFWNAHDCEFHKNESSWCADNALDNIEWFDEGSAKRLETWMEEQDRCSCHPLRFEYDSTVEAGPFRELREESTDEPSLKYR
jgi:hypothetical protein